MVSLIGRSLLGASVYTAVIGTLATVAAATLIVGGVLAAFVIFGPARRRLKAVEDAARRLGAGDLQARAPDGGSDEVAAVATAFNAMARDLAARTEALVAADRSRRQLLADVSHELNTPVTAMRGYLETLSMPEMPLDQAMRARYLSIVTEETTRLEHLIGELLELAVGSGATSVGDVRFDLKDRAKLEREALRLAVEDARAKADAAAGGAGRTIDRVVRIDAQPGRRPVPLDRIPAAAAARAEYAAPPIAAGQLEIRWEVTLTSTLK